MKKKTIPDIMEKPRWTALVYYRIKPRELLIKTWDFMEISELEALIENGPNFCAIDRIEIRYNFAQGNDYFLTRDDFTYLMPI